MAHHISFAVTILVAGLMSAPAEATTTLPIVQGLYVDAEEGCMRGTGIFFYDGTHFGDVYQGGVGSYGPSARVNRIQRAGPPPKGVDYAEISQYYKGFTLAWTAEDSGIHGSLAVKATSPGRFTMRSVSFGSGHVNGRVDVSDTLYMKCSFGQLSPKMQSAIRAARPQLADGSPPAHVSGGAIPAPTAPFNIRPGHYVPVAAPCGTVSAMIFYYDGRRAGWIDTLPFNPNHMDPVAGARRRGAGWLLDPAMGEILRVLAPDKIVIGDPNTGEETMRWCPAGEVRASAQSR